MSTERIALLTGGSRGIGRATARQLAARGLTIALQYKENEAAAKEVLALLGPGAHAAFRADLGSRDAALHLASEVLARFGRIDVLVNNAAIYEDHDPRGSEDAGAWLDTLERTLDVNLVAPAALSLQAIRSMRQRPGDTTGFGRGRIVNVTSRAAFRGELTAPGYAASKAGLNIFGQSLAHALAAEAIYVFTVAPGWVDTEMASSLHGPSGPEILKQHPLGRVATADEVARVITWLALDAPETATGSILDVNGASYLRT
jgi:NAD(P)-dependent dehydrogenase (short-subunit alcohol dehydrogenase family)